MAEFRLRCGACGLDFKPLPNEDGIPLFGHSCSIELLRQRAARPPLADDEASALLNTLAIWARGHSGADRDAVWELGEPWLEETSLAEMKMGIPGAWAGLSFGSWGGLCDIPIPPNWWSEMNSDG